MEENNLSFIGLSSAAITFGYNAATGINDPLTNLAIFVVVFFAIYGFEVAAENVKELSIVVSRPNMI